MAGVMSYNYTLDLQGLASNVSCSYEPTSPILYDNTSTIIEYSAGCQSIGEAEVLTDLTSYTTLYGENTLMFWACQSASNNTQPPSYSVYLCGLNGGYAFNFQNMTCKVGSIQPAVMPVLYQSTNGIFSTGPAVLPANEPVDVSQSAYSYLVNYTLLALGDVMSRGQNSDSNLVAESVITFGVKSFGLQPYVMNTTYLRLFEQMIQGIIEYQTTYLRVIYSTVSNRPTSCTREVTGVASLRVLGWYVTTSNIGFLIPLTLINLAALTALLLALAFAEGVHLHPRHPRPIIYDKNFKEEVPDEWKEKVAFRPTSILKEDLQPINNVLYSGAATAAGDMVDKIVK